MGYLLKQSSTAQPLVFLLVQSSDHITGLTGASPTVTLSKNGGAFASPAGSVTELANGWYKCAGNATDTATLGPLLLHATAGSADPCDDRYDVVAFDPQLALATPTNITAGTITTVTNLTNAASAGDFTSTMKSSLNSATPAVTISDKTGFALAAAGLDSVVVESGLNARQSLSIIAAAAAGVLAGAAGTSITIAGAGVVTNRLTATVDANGNRTAVAVSPPT